MYFFTMASLISYFSGRLMISLSISFTTFDSSVPKYSVSIAEAFAVMVEKYIGISKDYNIFELQKAMGTRNIVKANRIVNYFGANPKENPLVKTIAILYGFFSKLLIYHSLTDKSKNNVASALSVPPYFVQDYSQAARRYNKQKITEIIGYLRTYDLKAKGVDNISATDGELLKELMYKILH
jgi:DNA polymerase-3 subunit delta